MEALKAAEKDLIQEYERIRKEYDNEYLNTMGNNILEVKEWCKNKFKDKPKYLRHFPRNNKREDSESKLEMKLRNSISNFKNSNLFKRYQNKETLTEVEQELIEEYKKLEDEYNHCIYELGYNLLDIEEWCKNKFENKPKYLRRCPLDKSNDEQEKKLGMQIKTFKKSVVYKKYLNDGEESLNEAEEELIKKYKSIVYEYDYRDLNILGENILKIEEWCKETFKDEPRYLRRIPRRDRDIKTTTVEKQKETELGNKMHHFKATQLYSAYLKNGYEELTEAEKELIDKYESIITEYNISTLEALVLELEEWFENKPNHMRRLPKKKYGILLTKDRDNETEEQKEGRLADSIGYFQRSTLYKSYIESKKEMISKKDIHLIKKLEEMIEKYDGKKVTGQDIGQATFDVDTKKCDEAYEVLRRDVLTRPNKNIGETN